jgi:integrase
VDAQAPLLTVMQKWQITRDKYLSKEERSQLLKTTEEQSIIDSAKGRSTWVRRWMLVDLAMFSGLRVSEIANLNIGDIRLQGSEKLLYVKNGKGGRSEYITIDNALVKHIKAFLEWKKLKGESVDAQAPLLTGSSNGQPYKTSALQKQFKETLKKAKLPLRYSIHSCRHTFATYLLVESKNLRLVQKQLRHSSPTVTAVYADVTPEDMSEAMEQFRNNSNGNNSGSGKNSKGKNSGNNRICKVCNKKIDKPAVQMCIDGSEVEVCPVCCGKIKD